MLKQWTQGTSLSLFQTVFTIMPFHGRQVCPKKTLLNNLSRGLLVRKMCVVCVGKGEKEKWIFRES